MPKAQVTSGQGPVGSRGPFVHRLMLSYLDLTDKYAKDKCVFPGILDGITLVSFSTITVAPGSMYQQTRK